jgi:microcystin degradation protein MlrC
MSVFRVGIVGLLQESNTFINSRTTLDHFREDLLLRGEEIRTRMTDSSHEVGGFFDGLDVHGIVGVPLFLARALPFGVIEEAAFDTLVAELLGSIASAGELDGILAAPHGATVAENCPDADGYWLSRVRNLVGPQMPIIATVDPHANLSGTMVKVTDAIIAYATNPHLDQRETGIAAAHLMARTLAGEVQPVQEAAFPPLAINIQSQHTSELPMLDLYGRARHACEVDGGILSHSIVLGFPYADVPEMGSAAIVVADKNRVLATTLAGEIGNEMVRMRHQFEPDFIGVEEAVKSIADVGAHPVVLLDMGDNVGGGSPADSTHIVTALYSAGIGPVFCCLYDPQVAQFAISNGSGSRLDSRAIGDERNPLVADFSVVSTHDGRFAEREARHGGFSDFDQGPTAVLISNDEMLTVMVTSRRMPPYSLRQLTAFGVDPSGFKAIVAKGVIAPMAAYRDVAAGGFIHVDAPGVTRADMTKMDYVERRKPMFPFEEIG